MRNLRGRPASFQKGNFFLRLMRPVHTVHTRANCSAAPRQGIGGGVETGGMPPVPCGQRRCELQRHALGFAALMVPEVTFGVGCFLQKASVS
jgi:hypothetical protein